MSRGFDPLLVANTGVQLIEASAGTGKTYSITSLYLRLLLEHRLTVEQILVVTFTEAATAELHERIRARLRSAVQAFENRQGGDDPFLCQLLARSTGIEADRRLLLRAVSDIDKAAVSTIHGFAHRVLQQHALETGLLFELELTGATEALAREITDDYWSRFFYDLDPRLAGLVRQGVSPGQLRGLTQEAIRHSDFAIAGESPAAEEIPAQVREYCRLYAEARACWQEQYDALARYFVQAEGLTASFKTLLEHGLLDRIAAFFVQPEPAAFALPNQAELLAEDNIFQPEGKVFTATALKKGLAQPNPFFAPWGGLVAQAETLAVRGQALFLAGAAHYIRTELPKRLLAGQQQSFDQLLTGLDRALQSGHGAGAQLAQRIRARFPVALIDEFQDTDPIQYRIFRTIYGEGGKEALFLIGDPKQAIYGFRGADIYAYLEAASQSSASEKHTMTTNWRADRKMVAALNALFGPLAQPFGDARISYAQVGARPGAEDLWHSPSFGSEPLQFLSLPEDLCPSRGGRLVKKQLVPLIPELVAGDIAALLAGDSKIGDRGVRAGDIAVLVRTNTQAAEIQASLRSKGINGVLQSKASVWASPEAQECLRLLAAVAEPGNEQLLRKALATRMLGFTALDLERLNRAEAELHALMGRFSSWQGIWQKNGVMRMLMCAWQEQTVTGRLLLLADGERSLTNLRHLAELLQEAESRNHLSPAMLVDWFSRTLTASEAGEEAELRLESDEDAVQLVTIHRSKGLEYPVVYCPYLFLGGGGGNRQPFVSLHDPKAGWQGRIVLFPDEQARTLAAAERFAEELRLAYVAMTRARHSCHLLWAPASGYDGSALAWLLHGDQGLPDSPEALPQRLKGFTGQELLARLQDRTRASQGWQIRPLHMLPASIGEAAKPDVPPPLACRVPGRTLKQVWRIGSFSHLTAQSGHDLGEREPEAGAEGPAPSLDMEIPSASQLPLAQFPKGPVAGNFFHTLFEKISFQLESPAQLREQVQEQLMFYGYPELWLAPVCRAFGEVLKTPLRARDGFCLADIGDDQRLIEMPFTFPVGPGLGEDASLSAELLAQPFLDHPQGIPAGYAEALRALRFIPLRGFLKGFMDLVCVHEGKWYLFDYKSNHLGVIREDYAQEKLPAAMADHHYFLQYHIYTVALHRYLSSRLPGYDYDKDFGGVFYLFIKGMHPDSGPESGVYADLPPLARIEQLSQIFESLAGEGA